MSEKFSDDFKFGVDQENPNEVLQVAPEDNRIAKLSRRITVLAIIIPCLIGVALFFLYLDLKGRVVQNQASGNQSVSELSRDFSTQLQDFSSRLSQLEADTTEKSAAIEKSASELKTHIDKLDGSLKSAHSQLKKIDTAKADKKEQESLAEKLASLSTLVGTQNDALSQKMATMTADFDKISNDIENFRKEIGEFSTLVDSKIDRRTLLLELDKQQQKLTVLGADIEKKFITLQSEIRRLDKDLQQTRQALRQSAAPAAPPTPSGRSQSDAGKIVEQNLD
jgi:chromosome segregation ATPase